MVNNKYIVVGYTPWSEMVFNDVLKKYEGMWYYISKKNNLDVEKIRSINPKYIIFLHWSWQVPSEIYTNYDCICFHMTDVPYGRGGSPLQNLIIRGHKSTMLTALKMVEKFDAGPVYLKEKLELKGTAEEIFVRGAYIAADMIKHIIDKNPLPVPQDGEIVVFKRRKPSQSRIKAINGLEDLYNFIRMLDAPRYPKAFLIQDGYKFELSKADLKKNKLVAEVEITRINEK